MDATTHELLPDALVLGVPDIDAEHAEIFSRIEAIREACLETTEPPLELAGELLDFLRQHYATEERLARMHNVPFEDHHRKHQATERAIKHAIQDIQQGAKDVFSLLRYVEYWFERHIMTEDRSLAEKIMASERNRHRTLSERHAATTP